LVKKVIFWEILCFVMLLADSCANMHFWHFWAFLGQKSEFLVKFGHFLQGL
jgi:hypothetical protein